MVPNAMALLMAKKKAPALTGLKLGNAGASCIVH
jgi:hypothetical protein